MYFAPPCTFSPTTPCSVLFSSVPFSSRTTNRCDTAPAAFLPMRLPKCCRVADCVCIHLCARAIPASCLASAPLAVWDSNNKANPSCCPLRPRTTPFPEEKSILMVLYGVLPWAGMNAGTPLGAWERSVMSLNTPIICAHTRVHYPGTSIRHALKAEKVMCDRLAALFQGRRLRDTGPIYLTPYKT